MTIFWLKSQSSRLSYHSHFFICYSTGCSCQIFLNIHIRTSFLLFFSCSLHNSCHRNTIIQLRQRFQLTGRVADRRRPGRPRVTNHRMDRFITLTHLRRRVQTATSSARQYDISKRTVLRRLSQARQPIRPRRPYVGQVLTARHRAAICSRHNSISVGSDSSGLGFYSLMGLDLTLVIMTVEFEYLEEDGKVLLISISLRGTDFEVGVLWYGLALWAEGKEISLLCKTTSMLKVTLTRFCSLKLLLSFNGMGLQY